MANGASCERSSGVDGAKLRELRERKDLTIGAVAAYCGISSRTVSNIELRSNTNPKSARILSMLRLYAPADEEIRDVLGLSNLGALEVGGDSDEDHNELLDMFNNMSYRCFYVHEGEELRFLEIDHLVSVGNGCLRARGTARDYEYDSMLTCASEGTFAFIGSTSARPLSDRVEIFVPFSRKTRRHFNAGVGAALSLAFPKGESQHPRFQLICLVCEESCRQIEAGALHKACLLRLRLPELRNAYQLDVRDIERTSEEFYHELLELRVECSE